MLKKTIMLLVATALVTPLAAPLGGAHGDPAPIPPGYPCNPFDPTHHYGTGTSIDAGYSALPSVTWRTTMLLFDSCALIDGEGDFGVGGGFLPTNHHGSIVGGIWQGDVCVQDDVFGFDVEFIVGYSTGGGSIVEVASGAGCIPVSLPAVYPQPFPNPPSPGADGGIWVFLKNTGDDPQVAVQANLNPPTVDAAVKADAGLVIPTTGHIYTL